MIVLACLKDHIGRLVHPAAQGSALEAARHRMFITARLAICCAALAVMPLYLACGGVPGRIEALMLAWLVLPLVAVAHVSNTGDLASAEAMSVAAWIGLALTAFLGHACGIGPVCALLLLVPLECALSPTRRVAVPATIIAMVCLVGVLTLSGWTQSAPPAFGPTDAVLYLFATCHATALAFSGCVFQRTGRDLGRLDLQRHRVLSEAMGDLALRYDRSGLVLATSGASERQFGIKPQELMGRGFFDRVHVADRPAFLTSIRDAADGIEDVTVNLRMRLPASAVNRDGYSEPAFAWIEMRIKQIDDQDMHDHRVPRAMVVLAVIRDITIRVQHEAEIEQSKREAEQANASKDRFIATVSHELRTPLNSIIGFGEMLASPTLTPNDPVKQREYADIIRTSGLHLLAVVNSLLDLSKLDAGKFELRCEPFDPAGLIHACCDMVSLRAEQNGVGLRREIDASLDAVIGDKRACKQIVLNLLSNAVKFTPKGGRVFVTAKPDGNAIVVSVHDTGIGMVARDLAKLGDPFFQASGNYDRPYEGTGLGLSVVKGLVGLHGGSITVESSPGEGTRIAVRLPLDCRRAQLMRNQTAKIEVITRYPRSNPIPSTVEPQKVQKIA